MEGVRLSWVTRSWILAMCVRPGMRGGKTGKGEKEKDWLRRVCVFSFIGPSQKTIAARITLLLPMATNDGWLNADALC